MTSVLRLTGEERKQLRKAILSAYPRPGDLEIFVDEALGENLFEIAGTHTQTQAAFELIKWSIAKGHIDELVIALYRDTPQNPDIQRFCEPILEYLRQRIVFDADVGRSISFSTSFDWEGPIEDVELQAFLPRQLSFEADVGTLRRGLLDCANAVCKITFVDRDEFGTGVLIGKDLVLTNYHVLSRDETTDLDALNAIARSIRFEFGYVSSELGESRPTAVFEADGNQPVLKASEIDRLDYVLLRVEPKIENVDYIKPVPLAPAALPSQKTGLNVLQHPNGELMKVSLSGNGVVAANLQRGLVWYVNRTAGGSSGAPCFNDDWKLVALHHAEIPRRFGSIREGILFQAIHAEIASLL
ncbi:MAG: trypsin-like peptidase domain-containing protein [Cyanobacteria bacterium SID2]|nr:trypsin-like peptidase domain-containing protein [Cyanobacteria bacterium SID2]